MNTSIRILYLEHDAADKERIRTYLTEAGIACRITRVRKGDEFRAAFQFDFFERERVKEIRTGDKQVLATAKPFRTEEWVTRRDGEPELMDTLKTACYAPDGEILGLVGIGRDITERWWAEETRRTKLRFFECMDNVNRAIQGAADFVRMMSEVFEVVLRTFDCDRVSLVYPCDPESSAWQVLMERTKPENPVAYAPGSEVPADSDTSQVYGTLLAADGPVQFHPLAEHPLLAAVAKRLNEQSRLETAICPKGDRPYAFAGISRTARKRSTVPPDRGYSQ